MSYPYEKDNDMKHLLVRCCTFENYSREKISLCVYKRKVLYHVR